MAPKKTSARATKKVTKRPANATKATNMPSVAEMNTLVKSNTTKRDRALIALATMSALGAMGAACGKSDGCRGAVMGTMQTFGEKLQLSAEQARVSVGQTFGVYPARTSGPNPGVLVGNGSTVRRYMPRDKLRTLRGQPFKIFSQP